MRTFIAIFTFLFMIPLTAESVVKYDKKPPTQSEILCGYSLDSAKLRADTATIDRIEGVWIFPEDRLTISIERFRHPDFSAKFRYRLIALESENAELIPGSVIGYITDSASPDKFYIWLYEKMSDEGNFSSPIRCTATVDGEFTSISLSRPEIKSRFRINLSRFLPYLFRAIHLSIEKKEDKIPLGIKRIYPLLDEANSIEIRYL